MNQLRAALDIGLVKRGLRTLVPTLLAVGAFGLLAFDSDAATGPHGWAGVAAGWGAIALTWWFSRSHPLGTFTTARAVVAAGFLALLHSTTGVTWVLITLTALTLGPVLHEGLLRNIALPSFRVANLPMRRTSDPSVLGRMVWLANTTLIVLVGLFAALALPAWVLLLPAAAAAGTSGALFADVFNRRRRNRGSDLAELREALEELQPKFILHFSAPAGMHYQATMWLPYLERIGEPYFILLREEHSRTLISQQTSAPVVVCNTLAALDAAMVPSLRAAFYVNNGMKNTHCVRFSDLEHVQLLHGDSDKSPSFNPVTAMFDKVFVAGQAGIDRYAANGVHIPAEKFRIVGRPQVESLTVTDTPIRDIADKVVLYAPTWIGHYNDVNYCSLPIGEVIVRRLLDRGLTVILRHHPFATRDRGSAVQLERIGRLLAEDRAATGRRHVWGEEASAQMSLFDCINASHVMISDVSSVASDFLYTGKPFAITDMVGEGDSFVETFPLAAAAYVIDGDAGNLDQALDQLLDEDPLQGVRAKLRTHYLGGFPPEHYADAFLAEARRCLGDPVVTGPASQARVPRQTGPARPETPATPR